MSSRRVKKQGRTDVLQKGKPFPVTFVMLSFLTVLSALIEYQVIVISVLNE
jgi:hypothetical protein